MFLAYYQAGDPLEQGELNVVVCNYARSKHLR